MHILINQTPHSLPDGSSVADALRAFGRQPTQAQSPDASPAGPFAVAVNLQFVPRNRYADTPLREGDRLEVLTPITGG